MMRRQLRKVAECTAALAVLVGATTARAAGGCAPPTAWPQPGATPGHPDAAFAACLEDRAYKARGVPVPVRSKVAGVIAQCEVEVDRFEGAMIFGGAAGSDEQRDAVERRATRLAPTAIRAYQPCTDH